MALYFDSYFGYRWQVRPPVWNKPANSKRKFEYAA